jgi:hypothetical protein
MQKLYLFSFTFSLFFIQCASQSNVAANPSLYPTAVKYARTLYVSKAKKTVGNNRILAGHCSLKGKGQFGWQLDVEWEGEYELIFAYSVTKAGATVTVGSEKNTVTSDLQITKGLYEESKGWNKINIERKLLSRKLLLRKGIDSISLSIDAPDENFETILYTLELVPQNKKEAALVDLNKARRSRPEMGWFSAMKYGVMFHWTSLTTPETGQLKPYAQAVKDFDVHRFAEMVKATGADYVIFTGCWAQTYIPAPLRQWEKEYPGHTTKRDLIAEISDSLRKRNIKFILYLSTHVYAKYDSVDTKEFTRLNFELISEIGEHYRDKIAGYWFDGWYQSFEKHPEFDFEKFYKICKQGNPKRLVALNAWLYPIVTEWQDYWAGEVYDPGITPTHKIIQSGPGKGLQFHALLALQGDWVHSPLNTKIPPPRLEANDIIKYIIGSEGKGPVTINIEIYQDGSIDEKSLSFMKQIKSRIK